MGRCCLLSSLSRSRRCCSGWFSGICTGVVREGSDVIFVLDNDSNGLTKRYVLGTFFEEKLCDEAFLLHLEVDNGLISLDRSECIARLDLITNLLMPLLDIALFTNRQLNNQFYILKLPKAASFGRKFVLKP